MFLKILGCWFLGAVIACASSIDRWTAIFKETDSYCQPTLTALKEKNLKLILTPDKMESPITYLPHPGQRAPSNSNSYWEDTLEAYREQAVENALSPQQPASQQKFHAVDNLLSEMAMSLRNDPHFVKALGGEWWALLQFLESSLEVCGWQARSDEGLVFLDLIDRLLNKVSGQEVKKGYKEVAHKHYRKICILAAHLLPANICCQLTQRLNEGKLKEDELWFQVFDLSASFPVFSAHALQGVASKLAPYLAEAVKDRASEYEALASPQPYDSPINITTIREEDEQAYRKGIAEQIQTLINNSSKVTLVEVQAPGSRIGPYNNSCLMKALNCRPTLFERNNGNFETSTDLRGFIYEQAPESIKAKLDELTTQANATADPSTQKFIPNKNATFLSNYRLEDGLTARIVGANLGVNGLAIYDCRHDSPVPLNTATLASILQSERNLIDLGFDQLEVAIKSKGLYGLDPYAAVKLYFGSAEHFVGLAVAEKDEAQKYEEYLEAVGRFGHPCKLFCAKYFNAPLDDSSAPQNLELSAWLTKYSSTQTYRLYYRNELIAQNFNVLEIRHVLQNPSAYGLIAINDSSILTVRGSTSEETYCGTPEELLNSLPQGIP